MTSQSLGLRIKSLREQAHLTQMDLANRLNIGNSTLSQYESDKRVPSDDIKKRIADFFGVSLDYLMCNSNIYTAPSSKAISHKDKISYDEFMETAKAFFMDASEEDREAITRDISNLYWESKQINKNKYAPHNTKK